MPTVTHLLQPGHTYSNKATPPNSATSWAKHIQTITAGLGALWDIRQVAKPRPQWVTWLESETEPGGLKSLLNQIFQPHCLLANPIIFFRATSATLTSPQSQRGGDPVASVHQALQAGRDQQRVVRSVVCDCATSLSFPTCDWPHARGPRARCALVALPQPQPGSHAPQLHSDRTLGRAASIGWLCLWQPCKAVAASGVSPLLTP